MALPARSTLRATLKLVSFGAGLFLLLELSARVYLFGFAGLIPAKINSVHGLPQTGYMQPSRLPGLVFELKPNIAGYLKLVLFRTNSQGLRDREYTLRKPKNAFRVTVLGASFALPAGVEIQRAFHTLLEEQLTRQFAPTRYEFINFAVGMYSPRQCLATLELRALDYDPDLILFTATSLSAPRLVENGSSKEQKAPAGPSASENRRRFRKSYPILQSFFLRLVAERTGRAPTTPQVHVGVVENLVMELVEHLSPPAAAAKQATSGTRPHPARKDRRVHSARARGSTLQQLARVSERTGIPIVVVRLELDASEKLPIDLEVEQQTRALGIYYLDTRDAFRGTRPSDFWIYELDPHPNWRAHEIFARVVATFLDSNGLLPQ
jgi:hypothetical protein